VQTSGSQVWWVLVLVIIAAAAGAVAFVRLR
jgi:hypothetical protein